MHEAATDPAALEQLRAQRSRLADRMRPPWWYLTGAAIVWALVFASPFLPPRVRTWPILAAALAAACLLQWGLAQATGIAVGLRNLRYRPGRPARIAMIVVGVAALGTEAFLIRRGLPVAAIAAAAFAAVAEVAATKVALRGVRQDLRGGGGAA